MTIYSSYTITRVALVGALNAYMFYLGYVGRPVHKEQSTACRVMHGLSVFLCVMGAVAACLSM